MVSSGRTSRIRRLLAAKSASPACVSRAAFGTPVLPEDSISRAVSDGSGSTWSSEPSWSSACGAFRQSPARATRGAGVAWASAAAPGASVRTSGRSSNAQACRRRSKAGEPGAGCSAMATGRAPPSTQAQKAGKNSASGSPHSTTVSPRRSPWARRPVSIRRAASSSSGYDREAVVPSAATVTTAPPEADRAALSSARTASTGSSPVRSGSGPWQTACPRRRSMRVLSLVSTGGRTVFSTGGRTVFSAGGRTV